MNHITRNMADVTDLSEAAFDVFFRVRVGEECVSVDHLSPEDRAAVCRSLGVEPRWWWLAGQRSPAYFVDPSNGDLLELNQSTAAFRSPSHATELDVESAILDRQDRDL